MTSSPTFTDIGALICLYSAVVVSLSLSVRGVVSIFGSLKNLPLLATSVPFIFVIYFLSAKSK